MSLNIETALLRVHNDADTIESAPGKFTACCSGSNGGIYLFAISHAGISLTQLGDSTTGYTSHSLMTEEQQHDYKVLSISAVSDTNGNPLLGTVWVKNDDPKTFHLYATQDFQPNSNDRWISCGSVKGDEVSRISPGITKQGSPVLIAQVRNGASVALYRCDGGAHEGVETPTDSSGILQAEVLNNKKLSFLQLDFVGLSLQKPEGKGSTLTATSLPDRLVYNHEIPIEPDSNVMAVTDGPGDSDLFVGGPSGIYYYNVNAQTGRTMDDDLPKEKIKINKTPLPTNTTELMAMKDPSENLHLWVLLTNGDLLYSSQDPKSKEFSEPFPICRNTTTFASFSDQKSGSIHLLTLSAANQIRHHILDVISGVWSDFLVTLPSSNSVVEEVQSVTEVTITPKDATGLPKDATFQISSSGPAILRVNGEGYVVDSSRYVTVKPDMTNKLRIVQNADDNTAIPRLKLHTSLCVKPIEIDPGSVIVNKLKSVDAEKLKSASIESALGSKGDAPQKLVPKDGESNIDDAVGGFQQSSLFLSALSSGTKDTLPTSVDTKDRYSLTGGAVSDGAVLYSQKSEASHFQSPNVEAAKNLEVEVGKNKDTKHTHKGFFGHVIKWAKEAWDTVSGFVIKIVKGVVKVIIKIGEAIYEFLAPVLGPLFHFLGKIWDVIKVGLSKALHWLADLLGMDDILHTAKALKKIVNDQVDNFATKLVPKLSKLSDSAFAKLEEMLTGEDADWIADDEPIDKAPRSSQLSTDPKVSWVTTQVLGKDSLSKGSASTPKDQDSPTSSDAFDKLVAQMSKIGPSMAEAWKTVGDGKGVKGLLSFIGVAFLEIVRNAVKAMLTSVEAAILLIKEFLNSSASLPILGPLWKLLTGDTISLMDLICFVIAFPMTIIYKAAAGKAPFQDDVTEMSAYKAGMASMLSDADISAAGMSGTPQATPAVFTPTVLAAKSTDSDKPISPAENAACSALALAAGVSDFFSTALSALDIEPVEIEPVVPAAFITQIKDFFDVTGILLKIAAFVFIEQTSVVLKVLVPVLLGIVGAAAYFNEKVKDAIGGIVDMVTSTIGTVIQAIGMLTLSIADFIINRGQETTLLGLQITAAVTGFIGTVTTAVTKNAAKEDPSGASIVIFLLGYAIAMAGNAFAIGVTGSQIAKPKAHTYIPYLP